MCLWKIPKDYAIVYIIIFISFSNQLTDIKALQQYKYVHNSVPALLRTSR